ncbi:class I SAM-dependent methyltransferase [candidate division KSB1 bacterium]
MKLNEIELDFVDFIAQKKCVSKDVVKKLYLQTRELFDFGSIEYRNLCDTNHRLFSLLYGEDTEEELIKSYQFHELLHLYRFLSYQDLNEKEHDKFRGLFFEFIRTLFRGDFRRIYKYIERKIKLKYKTKEEEVEEPKRFSLIAERLVKTLGSCPKTIVDYGCGLGYISFEVAKYCNEYFEKNPKIYLVDIDCLTLEFVQYRFEKKGFTVEVVAITKDNIYPSIPDHDICIATEVMEHVKDPVRVFNNVDKGMRKGGVLHGDFGDHNPEMFHISTDLNTLRLALEKNLYKKLSNCTYKKSLE